MKVSFCLDVTWGIPARSGRDPSLKVTVVPTGPSVCPRTALPAVNLNKADKIAFGGGAGPVLLAFGSAAILRREVVPLSLQSCAF